jgi:hypothetical protein
MTQPSPPVWLLDIDGVINALARGPVHGSWPPDSWAQHVVRAEIPEMGLMVLPILVAEPVLAFVRRVVATGAAEVRWHSTWRTAAMTDLAPLLDLPPIPISIAPEWTQRPPGWWKLAAAQRVIAAGRRLVWTDDDLARYPGDLGGLDSRPDALLIAPDPQTGLGPADLDRIADFLPLPR